MENKKNPLIRSSKGGKERGASLIEYGLLVALIAVIGIPAVRAVGQGIYTSFDDPAMRTSLAGAGEVNQ